MRRQVWGILVLGLVASLTASAPAEGQVGLSPFAVVVIPDTQIYVQSDAGTEVFRDQFEWIIANQSARNIAFVTHEGDVAQNPSSEAEWDRIESVFAVLEAGAVPYGIAPGNHDIDADGAAPQYDSRFGVSRFAGDAWFGGSHVAEGNRSSYQMVSVDGHDLLFVHVRHLVPEFGSIQPVLDWVDTVLAAHPDRLAFVTTHEFTAPDGSVVMPGLQSVVEDHCNVAVVFSGHRLAGAARGTFDDSCGRTVHHVLTNYQHINGGGQGFLRTVDIDPLTLDAEFRVYSPTLDEFRSNDAESFDASLAALLPVAGDVTCDRTIDVGDALVIAQFAVGTRAARTSCPLSDPATELNIASADVDNDGSIDVGDALLVAQCTVGLPNVLCPG